MTEQIMSAWNKEECELLKERLKKIDPKNDEHIVKFYLEKAIEEEKVSSETFDYVTRAIAFRMYECDIDDKIIMECTDLSEDEMKEARAAYIRELNGN